MSSEFSEFSFTPIPLQIAANLRVLNGDQVKAIVALCHLKFNRNTDKATIDDIISCSGVSRQTIKPVLHNLMNRAWVKNDGVFYWLAFQIASAEAPIHQEVQYDAALGVRPARPKAHLLFPDGPWLTEQGLLDENFLRDRAEVWRTGDTTQSKAYGSMAIEDVMGIICKYYSRPENHAALEIDWQSYRLKHQRYFSNIHQRIQSGASIPEVEQETILKKLSILKQDNQPLYGSQLAFDLTPANAQSLESREPKQRSANSISSTIEVKPFVNQEDVDIGIQALSKKVAISQASGGNSRQELTQTERLNLWLRDPILRKEAEKEALFHDYELEYDETGKPFQLRLERKAS
jgi:hypothetical protein